MPIIPCDKLEVTSRYQSNQWFGKTSILLVRVGEGDQGVVGLHQTGIPGEIMPSLSARLMGLDSLGVASYLLTLYHSLAVLTTTPSVCSRMSRWVTTTTIPVAKPTRLSMA